MTKNLPNVTIAYTVYRPDLITSWDPTEDWLNSYRVCSNECIYRWQTDNYQENRNWTYILVWKILKIPKQLKTTWFCRIFLKFPGESIPAINHKDNSLYKTPRDCSLVRKSTSLSEISYQEIFAFNISSGFNSIKVREVLQTKKNIKDEISKQGIKLGAIY